MHQMLVTSDWQRDKQRPIPWRGCQDGRTAEEQKTCMRLAKLCKEARRVCISPPLPPKQQLSSTAKRAAHIGIAVLLQKLGREAAQRAQHRPACMDDLDLAVPRKRLGVSGEALRVPPIVTCAPQQMHNIAVSLPEVLCPTRGQELETAEQVSCAAH